MDLFYLLNNPEFTPWSSPFHFQRTQKRANAPIWVGNQELVLMQAIEKTIQNNQKQPKLLILWTCEPYYSTTSKTESKLFGIPMLIFNLWNKRSFFHNAYFLCQHTALPPKPQPKISFRSKKCCALITYPQESKNQITQERVTVTKEGHARKLCDIYGKGWPPGFSLGNSRDGEWWKSKPGILSNYDFCISMENCLLPYYVSEKLWDAILNGCLPIYCNNGTIYNDFPQNSFLDIRAYSTLEELWKVVDTMTLEEWNRRFDLCWTAMVTLWEKMAQQNLWKESAKAIELAIQK